MTHFTIQMNELRKKICLSAISLLLSVFCIGCVPFSQINQYIYGVYRIIRYDQRYYLIAAINICDYFTVRDRNLNMDVLNDYGVHYTTDSSFIPFTVDYSFQQNDHFTAYKYITPVETDEASINSIAHDHIQIVFEFKDEWFNSFSIPLTFSDSLSATTVN